MTGILTITEFQPARQSMLTADIIIFIAAALILQTYQTYMLICFTDILRYIRNKILIPLLKKDIGLQLICKSSPTE